jgi:sulfate ABC transporter permease subunit
MNLTLETVQQFVDESTLKDFIAEKGASLITDYYTGENTTAITEEEIQEQLEMNKDLIKETFDYEITEEKIQEITTKVVENDYIAQIQEEGIVNVVMGTIIGWVLVRDRFWGKRALDVVIDIPFALPTIVAGLVLLSLYGPNSPIGINWANTQMAVWLALAFVTLPFVVREVEPVLNEISTEQEEAAITLGASKWQTFSRITLPAIRWGLAYGVVLTVARSLGEFGALLVVSGNILGRTQTATLYVHDGIESFNAEGAYAASLLLAGVSFVMLIGMETLRKRVAAHEEAS